MNDESQAPFQLKSSPTNLIFGVSGALGACTSGVLLYPLDTVRTRLQLQCCNATTTSRRYKGVFSTFQTMVREEKVRALYRGLPVHVTALASWAFIYFGTYNTLKQSLPLGSPDYPLQQAAAAGGSFIAAVTVTNPLWIIKTRAQVQTGPFSIRQAARELSGLWRSGHMMLGAPAALWGAVTVMLQLPQYEFLKKTMVERGVFVRGRSSAAHGERDEEQHLPPPTPLSSSMRSSVAMAQPARAPISPPHSSSFVASSPLPSSPTHSSSLSSLSSNASSSYPLVSLSLSAQSLAPTPPSSSPSSSPSLFSSFTPPTPPTSTTSSSTSPPSPLPLQHPITRTSPSPTLTPLGYIICSVVSMTTSSLLTYPQDVVRARLQGTNRYTGVMHCLRTTIREESFRGLYSGLGAHLTRLLPTSAITFMVYEWTCHWLAGHAA